MKDVERRILVLEIIETINEDIIHSQSGCMGDEGHAVVLERVREEIRKKYLGEERHWTAYAANPEPVSHE
jgi:hypothetical protein